MAIGRTNAVGKAGTQFSLVVTVETGSLVTATKGSRSVSGTAVNGSCVLTLPEAGTWTVTATRSGQTSDTKTVSVVDSYAVTLTFFSATITVTAPSGAVVTLKKGGSTVDSKTSTGTAVFTVYETGEYTVEATQGGQSTNGTVNVVSSTTSYAITLSFVSDTLNENSWDTFPRSPTRERARTIGPSATESKSPSTAQWGASPSRISRPTLLLLGSITTPGERVRAVSTSSLQRRPSPAVRTYASPTGSTSILAPRRRSA